MFEHLYYVSVVFVNTMKHIHFHAIGNKFDRLHSIANEYYEKANDDSDLFGEWALEYGEQIQNPSKAASLLRVNTENKDTYNWEEGISTIANWISYYIAELERLRNDNTSDDVKSELDAIIRYWKKENGYKNKMRMKEI